MKNLIEIMNVSKVYDSSGILVKALDHVSLTIKDGEFIAIMGPSGSGKSTLLNILGCILDYSEGHYVINGKDTLGLRRKDIEQIRKSEIGFIYQHFALMDYYTAYENIELPLLINNVKKTSRVSKINEVVKLLGIEDVINKKPAKMSGGQQQRVAIARALVMDANIILADEPTGALDQKTGGEVLNLLKDINKTGKTVIIVTHDTKIASMTNRIITINDGKITNDSYNELLK